MSTQDEGGPVVDDHVCRLDLQAGWVDLTLHEGTKAEAKALATETVNRLNPLRLEIEKSAVFDDMVRRAVDLNEDGPLLAAAYYSENGTALANLVIDSYGEEGVPRPVPGEVQPLLLEWENGEVVGDPQVAHLELPAGPTVRVQSMLKVKKILGFGRRLTEFIKYAVFPPDSDSLIVVTATWEFVQLTEDLTRTVDELMPTLRIVPVDAGGNEIDTNPSR
ncbi:hypothetical protein AB0M87_12410 [Streptomyces sp. NPDC051320]|uniref:hypothetical protein n=1 Tax=Streptomyces sp. NPDC051320 TaxID=3154644 RepID=UPI00341BB3C2